ncbi:hypothetical protein BS78_06G066400 [Paspalum vaginatum]|nr:hypothetical protein BS78_06G066400 [Paspalum vaginatum]
MEGDNDDRLHSVSGGADRLRVSGDGSDLVDAEGSCIRSVQGTKEGSKGTITSSGIHGGSDGTRPWSGGVRGGDMSSWSGDGWPNSLSSSACNSLSTLGSPSSSSCASAPSPGPLVSAPALGLVAVPLAGMAPGNKILGAGLLFPAVNGANHFFNIDYSHVLRL